jgi:hypothetical protein
VDVLLFEGWMLGFQAAAKAELGNVIRVYPQLQARSLFCAASISVPCCVFLSITTVLLCAYKWFVHC